jgi:hypothetical protein
MGERASQIIDTKDRIALMSSVKSNEFFAHGTVYGPVTFERSLIAWFLEESRDSILACDCLNFTCVPKKPPVYFAGSYN